uniref:Putative acyl-CoA dehydrogenase, mitochondrial n=1 Tax=Trypanosoma congolense (strain IL3000) TaxID=1068625 RepID=G0UR95_TRYCI|nr:putative acyl-CoA dehydrogenase, mitochondrial precursor [Trypanosoma congolense IL3000]
MRRLTPMVGRVTGRNSSSYAAGLFNFKIAPKEMFPYPCHKVDGDEAESLQSLIRDVQKNSSIFTNLYGVRIGAEYGGMGVGYTAHALCYEEIGSKCGRDMLSLLRHSGVCTYLLSTVGDKHLKGKYLTAMSDGSIRMEWAVEEGFSSDLSMSLTKATPSDGKYLLTGRKICLDAASATHFLISAKTLTQVTTEEGVTTSERLSLFICAKDTPGLRVEKNVITLGDAPSTETVGAIGEGFKNVMITLFTGQYLYAAALLGVMKRVQQTLNDISAVNESVQELAASLACSVYAMEASIYALTAVMDIPAEDSLLECGLIGAFVQSTTARWLREIEVLIPSNGQLGDCISCARDIMGSTEHADFLYSAAVCCGVEDYGLFFQNASTLQMMQARLLRSLGVYDRVPVKNVRNASLIDAAVVKFGNAVEATFVRHGSHVQFQQLLLNRLGEAAALLYAASAVASRASMCLTKDLPSAALEEGLASCFIVSAVGKINALCDETCNTGKRADDIFKRVALDLCESVLQ